MGARRLSLRVGLGLLQVGIIKQLVEVCRVAQKEKVFRMALAALRNLLGYQDLGLASDMVEAGLNKVGSMWGWTGRGPGLRGRGLQGRAAAGAGAGGGDGGEGSSH